MPKNFSALLTRDIGNIGNCIFFLRSKKKKNQTNGAAGEKKFRVQCKNLAFYSTESHIESFFAEQKRKNGAAGKKKLRYSLDVRSATQFPMVLSWFNHGFFFFFFFFENFQTSVAPQQNFIR